MNFDFSARGLANHKTVERLQEAVRTKGSDPSVQHAVQEFSLRQMLESQDPDYRITRETFATLMQWNLADFGPADFHEARRYANEHWRRMNEANPSAASGAILRAGVQTWGIGMYLGYPAVHEQFTDPVTSTKLAEWYAPLHRAGLPQFVIEGQTYGETGIVGEDHTLVNRDLVGGESFPRNLWDDDQTGQISQRAGMLGVAMREMEDIYATGRLLGGGYTITGIAVEASKYSTKNASGRAISAVYDRRLYDDTRGNVLTDSSNAVTMEQLNFGALMRAVTEMQLALNPRGLLLRVMPKRVIVSTFDQMNVNSFLQSEKMPGLMPAAGGVPDLTGLARSAFMDNPLKKMGLTSVVNPYLPKGAWVVQGELTGYKGLVKQIRKPMQVMQEDPNAGKSFETRSFRFQSWERLEIDALEARCLFMGYDGNGFTGFSGAGSAITLVQP